ncbi:MAG: hypothetical protein JOZ54_17390 [Acidobacteria bacterium]|nr:hypothetical protein [Acidobacteriota bacterium]
MKRNLALLFVLLVACGKRGDPRPPVPVIPKATSDLVVTQRGTHVMLAWSYPSLTTSGKSLSEIRRVVVYRYSEELPVAPTGRDPNAILPGDIDPTMPPQIYQFEKIPAPTPVQFAKLRERVDSIEGANLPAATNGARLTFDDQPALRSKDGRAVRLSYAVVTETVGSHSDLSNLATIVPLDVPLAPAGLAASAKPEGAVLTWTKPDKAATSDAKPWLVGYNVYRTSDTFDELATPINPSPVAGETYTDTPPYGTYHYRVTAVASPGLPRIESEPSAPVTLTYKDLLPPAAPATVTALVETKSVRLVWDAVPAADLAGYLVYRTEGKTKLKLTPGPVTAEHFSDISVDPGITYFYSVTAVDKSGNESKPTNSESVLVPKTP